MRKISVEVMFDIGDTCWAVIGRTPGSAEEVISTSVTQVYIKRSGVGKSTRVNFASYGVAIDNLVFDTPYVYETQEEALEFLADRISGG